MIKPLGSNRPESVAPAIPPVQKPYEQIKQEPTQDTYTITDTETSLQLQGENKPQENKTEQPAPSNEPSSEDILRSVESLSKDQGTINLGNTPSQPGPAAPME